MLNDRLSHLYQKWGASYYQLLYCPQKHILHPYSSSLAAHHVCQCFISVFLLYNVTIRNKKLLLIRIYLFGIYVLVYSVKNGKTGERLYGCALILRPSKGSMCRISEDPWAEVEYNSHSCVCSSFMLFSSLEIPVAENGQVQHHFFRGPLLFSFVFLAASCLLSAASPQGATKSYTLVTLR